MHLIMNPTQFNNDNVILNEAYNASFTRLVYSNHIITTVGVQIKMDIKCITLEKRGNKTNIQFNIYNNRELITTIQRIEQALLLSKNSNKYPVYAIYNELILGRISIHDYTDVIVLKISGIWETDTSYGVTYKFI